NIAGKLVFYQMEGNATYVRDTGELASDVPTETMFELYDPQKNFSKTNFSYTWDLGNKVIKGSQPVVRYHYTESGNYTLRLKLGAVKNVKMKGQPNYAVSQNASLAFHVDGPPMWVCWRFLKNCAPDSSEGCTLTMLYDNSLQLNHTFTTAGVQCLDMSVRNDISKLQTSFSLYVANLLFILSCAAVLVATFSFIVVIACRPRHQ
uniref:Transmembrane protein 130 n=1 Tax=Oryzias melastigma TaxID=30732 RepID=A0A3B3BJS7_ORYME